MARDLSELVDAFIDQENLRLEGRRGIEALCQISAALGYKDPTYFGQLTQAAILGDFIEMLQDNPCVIEAIVETIKNSRVPEWIENMEQVTNESDDVLEAVAKMRELGYNKNNLPNDLTVLEMVDTYEIFLGDGEEHKVVELLKT